ncbi:FKBP-type peptidyl-prolyl cis-trans isomerase [Porphyromonas sp.]|uniref:FKBP-type peptidyl-prolyl cis-trans isomerase n=1 Tax=Porphyromonas sp. TaxID=1924944 RepID=UPI0026DB3344|nr:FKBP-type peptidyl-prolyl cis-trans isomerase [Porphyromonas sp.]MDO4695854.1 FKBP-type peptidyl-prolyl cis-trans isomerase [Porphyromonas sp.]MDO4770267.1 FKBP-type peptidyl-prolyl cis-trans isomerase [Porphyromonas sp.]
MDKISYALGLSIGNNFKASGVNSIVVEDFVTGLSDVLADKDPQITYEDAKVVINEYFMKLQQERFENNKAAGAEFLKINGCREDVTTLPSGLQYQVLTMGDGPKPTLSDSVKCHYHGTLINGVVFDSSINRGEPAVFTLTGVIKGWTEILQLMPVGSKWRVIIPYDLAYGEGGAGQSIEPYSTLIFDIELLAIEK